MDDRTFLAEATTALRNSLCEFPSMFTKGLALGTADEFHTASATLVDLGHGPLAITCAHVITDPKRRNQGLPQFIDMWRDGKALIRVGNTPVSHSQLVGLDEEVDLATIRLSDEQATDLENEEGMKARFYTPHEWPPHPAKEGEWVAFGGFPGQWRKKRPQTQEILLHYYGVGATAVTSAGGERQFGCKFEREHWIWMSHNPALPDLTALGGLSGGPVFAERDLRRELVGIITDFREDCDIMLIAHTKWIKGDGSITADHPWGRAEARAD